MRSNTPAFPAMAAQLSVFLPSQDRNRHESQSRAGVRLSTERTTNSSDSEQTSSPAPADSDQLVLSNAVIGLIAASAKYYKDLDVLNTAPNAETNFLSHSLSVLKSFKLTIQLIYKFLRRLEIGTLERKDRPSLIGVDIIIVVLSEATFAVSEVGKLLSDAVSQVDHGSSIAEIFQERRASLEKQTRRIAVTEVAMTKVISVLQVDSEPEARRHLSQAEAVVYETLQQNTVLADGIRQMTDSFGARALVSRERLEAIAARGPPAYSVPTSLAEELPDYSAAVSNGVNADGSVTIRPTNWSVFSGLTLGDISILSLIPLPIKTNELGHGAKFHTFEYSRRVNEQLGELAERNTRNKAEALARILEL